MAGKPGSSWRGVVLGLVAALSVRTLVFEPFNIPSGSMIPNLLVGDYVFVSKYAYGYSHYSLPFSPPLFKGRIMGSTPLRGDIVVFKFPSDTSVDYVKRVVGLPGDRIQMRMGQLYINDVAVPRRMDGHQDTIDPSHGIVGQDWIESPPGTLAYTILKGSNPAPLDNTVEFHVPQDSIFCMGDNRDNSSDSRVDPARGGVGYVPLENLVGRAEFVIASDANPLWAFWTWPTSVRWNRFLAPVH